MYAIDDNGNLYAWGETNLLGLGDSVFYPEPIKISNKYKQASYDLIIDMDNKLRSYGMFNFPEPYYYLPNSKLMVDEDVKDFIKSGGNAIYYVDSNNNLNLKNIDNRLSVYYNGSVLSYTLTLATDGLLTANVVDYVDLGNYSGMALDANNDLKAWGFNHYKRYGNTKKDTTWYPIYQIATDYKVSKFAATNSNTFIIDTNGNLYGTGDNTYGQLGNGTTTSSSSFIPIMSGTKFKDVKASNYSFVAVTTDNKIYFCGRNSIASQTATPVQIPFSGSVASIEYYEDNLVIKDTQDVLWGLGNNYDKKLGLGDISSVSEFTKLFNGKKIKENKISSMSIYAVDKNDDLYVTGAYLGFSYEYGAPIALTPYKLLSNIESIVVMPNYMSGSGNFFIFKGTNGDYYGLGNNYFNVLLDQTLTIDKPALVNFYK